MVKMCQCEEGAGMYSKATCGVKERARENGWMRWQWKVWIWRAKALQRSMNSIGRGGHLVGWAITRIQDEAREYSKKGENELITYVLLD